MTIQKQLWTILVEQDEFISNTAVTLKEDELHYIANVLRLKVGDDVEITNCRGLKCLAKIEVFTKKEAKLVILNVLTQKKTSPEIHLYLALPKPSTLEEVIASVSEMGLDEIHIFRSEKCASKAPVKLEKLERISNEAVRISKSAFSTKVFSYETMQDVFLKRKLQLENGLNLFCDESHVYENKVTNSLLKILQEKFNPQQNINIFIGPEASFSSIERDFIFNHLNCCAVSLGDNILRVPNAVYSAFSIVNQVRITL